MTRISEHVKMIAATPPWYVRAFGVALLSFDAWWWIKESAPVTILELAKHGILLAIGLACFYPEGLVLVHNVMRRLPFFNRRMKPRDEA